jgi:hypothetical protein
MTRIFAENDYAYIPMDAGLQVISMSDPETPVVIENYPQFDIMEIAANGNYAYLGTFSDGLQIVDISDPYDIQFIAGYLEEYDIREIAVSEDFVFLIGEFDSLLIVDVGDPTEPALIGEFPFSGWVPKVRAVDNYAYISYRNQNEGHFEIIDVSDPTNPISVSDTSIEPLRDLWVDGDYAYLLGNEDVDLLVYDISDPTSPIHVGGYQQWHFSGTALFVKNDLLFVPGWQVMKVFDISDPTSPAHLYNFLTFDYSTMVYVTDTYAYVDVNPYNEVRYLRIIDFSDPSDPHPAGDYTPGRTASLALSGNYVFVPGIPALSIYDMSDPISPFIAGSYSDGSGSYLIDLSGDYAYIITGSPDYALLLIDISDIENPVLTGETFAFGHTLVAHNGYAYAVTTWDGMRIYDCTDPYNPHEVAIYDSIGHGYDVFVRGEYAYLSDGSQGIHVLDISNPYDPQPGAIWDFPEGSGKVFVTDDHFYNSGRYEFAIYTMQDPLNISFEGSVSIPFDFTHEIKIVGNYAYLGRFESGLLIIDISNSSDPVIVASYDRFSNVNMVDLSNDYIFVAAMSALVILQFDPETEIIEEISEIPNQFFLSQNNPNPFNASTTIRYDLSTGSDVTLDIYDILGRKIETLVDGWQLPGAHSIVWDAEGVSSGVYFYRIQAGEYVQSKSCLLLK